MDDSFPHAVEYLRYELRHELDCDPEVNTLWCLRRFYVAVRGDYQSFRERVRDCLVFRAANLAHAISSDFRADCARLALIATIGHYHYTREGLPVFVQRIKNFDPAAVANEVTLEAMTRFMLNTFERRVKLIFPVLSEMFRRRIDKAVVVFDMRELNVSRLMNSYYKSFIKFCATFAQKYYPESVAQTIMVNSPLLLKGAFTLVSFWLDPVVRKKIRIIYGSGKRELFELIEPRFLPVFLGGECTDEVADNPGPWQPEFSRSVEGKTAHYENRSKEREYFYTQKEFEAILAQEIRGVETREPWKLVPTKEMQLTPEEEACAAALGEGRLIAEVESEGQQVPPQQS